MKRLFALMLCFTMLLGSLSVMAQGTSLAGNMEAALLIVKEKVDVPPELTEFDSSSYNYDEKITYSFSWSDKDRTASLNVNCDELGRISNYNYYYEDLYRASEGNQLATVTKEEVIKAANEFVAKLLPETTKGNVDVLACDRETISASVGQSGTIYNIPYKRMKDGNYVDGNVATVTVYAVKDKTVVSNAYCTYDYDTKFKEEAILADFDYVSAYQEKFPEQLVYIKAYDDKGKPYTKLVYRFKDQVAGHISAATGEPIEKDIKDDYRLYAAESAADLAKDHMVGNGLTPEEIKELKNVAGLKTEKEIEKMILGISALKIDKDLLLQES
ncbi:MAG: hypothetical protein PHE51_08020, partial [Eubacteriales bacterium]|nr:hypothetical protein [Eubacteriales bacterium]